MLDFFEWMIDWMHDSGFEESVDLGNELHIIHYSFVALAFNKISICEVTYNLR